MPHAHNSKFMPPRQPVLLEPSLWDTKCPRACSNMMFSLTSAWPWELHTRKQASSWKTELSENGTSLAQGGISQTLVRYTSPQVTFPPSHGNGNQLHGSHFPKTWGAGTTRVRNATIRRPLCPLLGHPPGDQAKLSEWGWLVSLLRSLELFIKSCL